MPPGASDAGSGRTAGGGGPALRARSVARRDPGPAAHRGSVGPAEPLLLLPTGPGHLRPTPPPPPPASVRPPASRRALLPRRGAMTGPFPRAGSSRRGVCRAPAPPPDAAPDRPDRLRAGGGEGGGQSGAAVTHPGAGGKAGGAGSILAAPGGGRSGAERGTAQGPGRHPALRSPPRRRGLCQGHVSLPPAAMAPRPYTGPGRGAGARHVRRRRRGPVAEHVRGGGTWGRNGARRGSAGARGPAAARKADNGGKTGGAHVVAAAVAVAAQRRGPAAPRGPGLRAAVAATLGPVPPPSAGSPPPAARARPAPARYLQSPSARAARRSRSAAQHDHFRSRAARRGGAGRAAGGRGVGGGATSAAPEAASGAARGT